MENIINIIAQGILSIIGALASYFIAIGVAYLKKKKDILINQIGVDKYNKNYKLAQDVYYAVEQQFKFSSEAGLKKAEEFDKLLLKKIPGISQEELDHFREAICGKINTEIKQSQILAPAFDSKTESADVTTQNIQ